MAKKQNHPKIYKVIKNSFKIFFFKIASIFYSNHPLFCNKRKNGEDNCAFLQLLALNADYEGTKGHTVIRK